MSRRPASCRSCSGMAELELVSAVVEATRAHFAQPLRLPRFEVCRSVSVEVGETIGNQMMRGERGEGAEEVGDHNCCSRQRRI